MKYTGYQKYMKNVNFTDLNIILLTGNYTEVRGPKPDSYEYKQAENGLNDKKLWWVI